MTAVATRPVAARPARGAVPTLVVANAGTLLVLLAFTMPISSLPTTAAGLHSGPAGRTRELSGIGLGLAALLLVAGGLADDYGRRRVFALGAVVFAAASAAAAAAPDTGVFIAARIAEGAGAAALLSTALGLVGHAVPAGPARARATATWGAMVGAGITIGPLLAGLLTQLVSWRAGYGVVAVAGAVLAVAARLALAESRAAVPRRPDAVGALTLGAGLSCLLAALVEGRTGWARWPVAALFAVAAAALVAFMVSQVAGREPLLDLGLFRRPEFAVATGGALFTGLSVIALMNVLPAAWERRYGLGPLAASGVYAIWAATSFLASLAARRIAGSGRAPLAVGFALAAAGQLAMVDVGSWPWLVPGLLVSGTGTGLLNAALGRLAVASVPAGRAAMGSGANNTARYLGSSVGIALVVAVTPGQAAMVAAGFAAAGALFTAVLSGLSTRE
ncbi:MAG: MFS transporter [Mycobacteriales bacterium]